MENQEQNSREPINLEGGMDVTYHLEHEDVVNTLTVYNKEVHGTKGRTIQLIVCAVLIVGFTFSFIKDPTYIMGLVLAIVSLLLGVLIWFMPKIQINTQAKAIAQQDNTYSISFRKDSVVIGEGEGLYNILYTDPVEAYENNQYFLLVFKKSKIFCIPKRFIEKDLLNIRILLKDGLGERFHDLMIKESVNSQKPDGPDPEQK